MVFAFWTSIYGQLKTLWPSLGLLVFYNVVPPPRRGRNRLFLQRNTMATFSSGEAGPTRTPPGPH